MWYGILYINNNVIKRGTPITYKETPNSHALQGVVLSFRVVDGKYLYRVSSNPAVSTLTIETELVYLHREQRRARVETEWDDYPNTPSIPMGIIMGGRISVGG